MKKRTLTIVCILVLLIGALGIAAAAEADVITLQESTASMTIEKDTYLNLNGFSIENVTVNESATLYVFDKKTDDYTVADGKYGKIAAYNGKVAAADGYVMINDEGYSFHKVDLALISMSLRADKVGLYCKSNFKGDEVVAANVKTFGVAMNIQEEPTAKNLNDCACSSFDGSKFTTGEATSTILKGIMKERNSYLINNSNANTLVYAKAYIQLQDGSYVFGECQSRNLKEQVEAIAGETWEEGTTAEQKEAVVSMYRKFYDVMDQWAITKVESAAIIDKEAPVSTDKSSLKILAITSSFGQNTTELLYDIAKANGYEDVVVARLYGSGCTQQKHVNNALNNLPFYQYTKNNSGTWQTIFPEGKQDADGNWTTVGATMQYGLEDEDWDIIFTQQGADNAGHLPSYGNYVDQLMEYLYANKPTPNTKFVWNMTWAFQKEARRPSFERYFQNDQMIMYNAIVNATQKKIITRTDFDAVIPSGTAIQNARTSYFGDNLCITRNDDYIHLNTLGRVVAGHALYATLTGKPLEEIALTTIPAASTPQTGSITLTENDKLVILEAVNNALADPFHVTQSVYNENN